MEILIGLCAILFFVFTFMFGYVLGRDKQKTIDDNKTVKPVCDCGHSKSFHEPGERLCYGLNEEKIYDAIGSVVGRKKTQCTCVQYIGPEPITEYYAPEIESREE